MVQPVGKGGISSQISPFSTSTASSRSSDAQPVGKQVQQALFGRPKPPLLDPGKFPALLGTMQLMHKWRKKLATMAGDGEEDYDLVLADGTIAMIDEEGTIYVGAGFLSAFGEQHEVLAGVLAHEIGHRPKRWNEYRTPRQLTYEELHALARYEETRADIFAGKALAELGMSCEPLTSFLEAVSEHPHPEYFPVSIRAKIIRDAHEGRAYRRDNRGKIFPEYDRHTSVKSHIGDF